VQALWLNALAVAASWRPGLAARLELGRESFAALLERGGGRADVVDVDHERGR
jgi:hypothetical protein